MTEVQSLDTQAIALVDKRTAHRFETTSIGTVTNISRANEHESGQILNLSHFGMQVETPLAICPGDALRIDLADHTLLAEAVHCTTRNRNTVAGLKIFHTLNYDTLRRYVDPGVWSAYISESLLGHCRQ